MTKDEQRQAVERLAEIRREVAHNERWHGREAPLTEGESPEAYGDSWPRPGSPSVSEKEGDTA